MAVSTSPVELSLSQSPTAFRRPRTASGGVLVLAIALDRAHKYSWLKRITELAPAARFTIGPNPWLRADKSAASNALFAGWRWKAGIRRGSLPIAWLQVLSGSRIALRRLLASSPPGSIGFGRYGRLPAASRTARHRD